MLLGKLPRCAVVYQRRLRKTKMVWTNRPCSSDLLSELFNILYLHKYSMKWRNIYPPNSKNYYWQRQKIHLWSDVLPVMWQQLPRTFFLQRRQGVQHCWCQIWQLIQRQRESVAWLKANPWLHRKVTLNSISGIFNLGAIVHKPAAVCTMRIAPYHCRKSRANKILNNSWNCSHMQRGHKFVKTGTQLTHWYSSNWNALYKECP